MQEEQVLAAGHWRRNAARVLAGVLVIAGSLAGRGTAGEPGELLMAAAPGLNHPTVRRGENCLGVEQSSLPLPSTVPAAQFVDFEKRYLAFLQSGEYRKLGWCVDKGVRRSPVRDTGPFVEGVYYGTHPAVRIYYSPTFMRWLKGGRQGAVPDGAMIIKEQYPPPAARYAGLTDAQLPAVADWTIMFKDSRGSKDGWFWGEFFVPGMTFDDDRPPFQYPWAGFGLYCLRCHSIAEREHTFGSLNNIKGFPGQPIVFFDDGSWRTMPPKTASHGPMRPDLLAPPDLLALPQVEKVPDPEFLQIFNSIPKGVPLSTVQRLPSETFDNIVAPASGPGSFISSSQCLPCHSALNGPFGPVMFLPSPVSPSGANGANVSPYGEWRWSPMGLAGRDPIFYSQLEGEFAYFNTLPPPRRDQLTTTVRNLCLTCHGSMGKRQLDTDSGGTGDFKLEFIQLTDRDHPQFKYGALARDGISCETCHRQVPDRTPPGVSPLAYFLTTSITGKFQVGTPDQIFGPVADNEIVPFSMFNGIGITPQFSPYIQSSRMCGSCHTIDLPVVDGTPGQMSIEQGTYLEWLNSQYQTEFGLPGPNAVSCQGCHMPRSYHNAKKEIDAPTLEQKIAIIEDETYPEAEHAVPIPDRTVSLYPDFARHEFLGANAFLLQMFYQFKDVTGQFNDVLGVRIPDYMSGSTTDLPDAIDNVTQQAQERTARIGASARALGPSQIQADVAVTSLVGHKLPSGVGFRRAFLEVLVRDAQDRIVWSSGRTNRLGIIVNGHGQILPSEFLTEYIDAQGAVRQHYQPHYEVITSQDQVQIYEELVQNADGKFTTSFVRRDTIVKDNRLLPIGWTKDGPDPSLAAVDHGRFLHATHPEGSAADDPDYQNGRGTDHITYRITLPPGVNPLDCTVRATLRYQAIPPYYLNARFSSAPTGDATRRLYYLTSNLDLGGTSTENWSLPLASTTTPVKPGSLATAD